MGSLFSLLFVGIIYDTMISLDKYLNKYSPTYKMTDDEKDQLLTLDKEFGDYFRHFRENWTPTESTNVEEEWVKFKKAKDKGEKYYNVEKGTLINRFIEAKYVEDDVIVSVENIDNISSNKTLVIIVITMLIIVFLKSGSQ